LDHAAGAALLLNAEFVKNTINILDRTQPKYEDDQPLHHAFLSVFTQNNRLHSETLPYTAR
jgi:hypothetical protein